ncbi:hypothetical protein QQY66_01225 [Streptomyces sp. DG2A-72]|uniref:hypothetical protein n=1 Tax=Streptomyces sp. DG2A-72 TaxID=3051386 RepID=UPI00265BB7F6|nr:hypothetical protein [Streptomyces sp. DG2A-72]MDO0930384.1 hypothetical protein [Streptomyces sp. DG2A-72]
MLDPELLERITARRVELDELEEQLAKQLTETRAERDELAVAERVLERVSEQLAQERAETAAVPGHVGGQAVMVIPHRAAGVEETALPPDYQGSSKLSGAEVSAGSACGDAVSLFQPRAGERVEPRRMAMAYVKALVAPVERKNGGQIAEHVGHPSPYRVQWFLARSIWCADQLRDALRSFVGQYRLGAAPAPFGNRGQGVVPGAGHRATPPP